jgi:hypothetical protein
MLNAADGLRGTPASLSADRLQQRGREPIEDGVVCKLSRTPRAEFFVVLGCPKPIVSDR